MTESTHPSATSPVDHRLRRRTTSDDVVAALRSAILAGEFTDGDELNQVTLAKRFGVSRVPVREALRQLQAEGLVHSVAHMRTTVRGLDVDRVLEVLDVRILVEGYLLAKAASNMDDDAVSRLEQLVDAMDTAEDQDTWLELNREFHTALYAASKAEFVQELADQLQRRIQRYVHMRSDAGVDRHEEANIEHRRIVDALRRGDVDRATLELELHIAHTRDRVVRMFAEKERSTETNGG